MFLQHFDYICYYSNHNFHVMANKMMCIISTLPPVHIPSFMKLAWIAIEISQDPDFSRQTDGRTDRGQTFSHPMWTLEGDKLHRWIDWKSQVHEWKFKISKILNFRNSNLKNLIFTISSLTGWMSFDRLKIHQRSYCELPNSGFWGRLSVESQPQNPEFRNNPENFHQCKFI